MAPSSTSQSAASILLSFHSRSASSIQLRKSLAFIPEVSSGIRLVAPVVRGRGTVPFSIAGNWHAAQRHNDSDMAYFIHQTFHPRARVHCSARCRYLVGMLRNHRVGFDQVIHGEGCLVRPHRENISHVDDSEIRFVEPTQNLPIPDKTGVAGPKDCEAVGESDDIARLMSGITG